MKNIDLNNIDYARREAKEEEDYQITSYIFKNYIFSGSSQSCETEKFDQWSVPDCAYTARTTNRYDVGIVEIKTRNQDMDLYNTLPIKVEKYCNMDAACADDVRCIYFVLVNDEEYYLFDLRDLDMNKCTLKMLYINKTEYVVDKSKQEKEKTAMLLIPITQAKIHGRYDKERVKAEIIQQSHLENDEPDLPF